MAASAWGVSWLTSWALSWTRSADTNINTILYLNRSRTHKAIANKKSVRRKGKR